MSPTHPLANFTLISYYTRVTSPVLTPVRFRCHMELEAAFKSALYVSGRPAPEQNLAQLLVLLQKPDPFVDYRKRAQWWVSAILFLHATSNHSMAERFVEAFIDAHKNPNSKIVVASETADSLFEAAAIALIELPEKDDDGGARGHHISDSDVPHIQSSAERLCLAMSSPTPSQQLILKENKQNPYSASAECPFCQRMGCDPSTFEWQDVFIITDRKQTRLKEDWFRFGQNRLKEGVSYARARVSVPEFEIVKQRKKRRDHREPGGLAHAPKADRRFRCVYFCLDELPGIPSRGEFATAVSQTIGDAPLFVFVPGIRNSMSDAVFHAAQTFVDAKVYLHVPNSAPVALCWAMPASELLPRFIDAPKHYASARSAYRVGQANRFSDTLAELIAAASPSSRVILFGHSMGTHVLLHILHDLVRISHDQRVEGPRGERGKLAAKALHRITDVVLTAGAIETETYLTMRKDLASFGSINWTVYGSTKDRAFAMPGDLLGKNPAMLPVREARSQIVPRCDAIDQSMLEPHQANLEIDFTYAHNLTSEYADLDLFELVRGEPAAHRSFLHEMRPNYFLMTRDAVNKKSKRSGV
jgi:esterase/lipase superfamily enzyme